MTHEITIELLTGAASAIRACTSSGSKVRLSGIWVQGKAQQDVTLSFTVDGGAATVAEVANVAGLTFGVKADADFLGDYVALLDAGWTLSADGLTYSGTVDFDTAEVVAALGTAASVKLNGQIGLTYGGENVRSQVFDTLVAADVITSGTQPAAAAYARLVDGDGLSTPRAPTADDDSGEGYGVGSVWVYSATVYTLTDATEGAAVWSTSSGDMLAANNLSDVADSATARANLGAAKRGTDLGSDALTLEADFTRIAADSGSFDRDDAGDLCSRLKRSGVYGSDRLVALYSAEANKASGTALTKLYDLSGNAYDLTGTATLNASGSPDSAAAVESDGSSDTLTGSFGKIYGQTNYIIATARVNHSGVGYLWDGDDSTNRHALFTESDGDLQLFAGSALNNVKGTTSGWAVYIAKYAPLNASCVCVGGALKKIGDAGDAPLDGLSLFASNAGAFHGEIDLKELAIVNGDDAGTGSGDALANAVAYHFAQRAGLDVGGGLYGLQDERQLVDRDGDLYAAFGVVATDPGGVLHGIYRSAATHVGGTDGFLFRRKSFDGGKTWADRETVVDNASIDDRGVAFGITSEGIHVLIYGKYNGSSFTEIKATRSLDGGATWETETSISTGTDTTFLPYGSIIEKSTGDLMVCLYGDDATNYRLWTLTSSDSGATWGTEVEIVNATGTQYTEGCLALAGSDDDIICISRDNAGTLHQFKSDDGGATWSDQGDLTISTGTGSDVSPWIASRNGHIVLCWGSRSLGFLRYASLDHASALASHANWTSAFSIVAMTATSSADFGYPSLVWPDDEMLAPDIYYNDANAAEEADIYRISLSRTGAQPPSINADFPTSSASPGKVGQLAFADNEMASHNGTRWIFYQGYTK